MANTNIINDLTAIHLWNGGLYSPANAGKILSSLENKITSENSVALNFKQIDKLRSDNCLPQLKNN
jgi:hypothetical protein